MMRYRKYVMPAWLKVVLTLLGLYAAGYGLVYFKVVDALLAFSFGGAIVGTSIVMSPDAQLRLVAGVFAAGVLLAIVKAVFGRSRRLAARRAAEELVVPASLQAPHIRMADKVHLQKDILAATAANSVRDGGNRVQQMIRIASSNSQSMVARLLLSWAKVTVDLIVLLQRATRRLWLGSASAWKWAEPHLWRFDGWLETQTHVIGRKALRVLDEHDASRFAVAIVRQYSSRLNTVFSSQSHQTKQLHSQPKQKP